METYIIYLYFYYKFFKNSLFEFQILTQLFYLDFIESDSAILDSSNKLSVKNAANNRRTPRICACVYVRARAQRTALALEVCYYHNCRQ